jgi:transposase
MMRYELTDHEWAAIEPMLPNKARFLRPGYARKLVTA